MHPDDLTAADVESQVQRYERGLDALARSEQPDDVRRCELLLALGEARWSAGQIEAAEQAYLQAADLADALGGPRLRADSMMKVGRLYKVCGRPSDACAAMTRARQIAHDAGETLVEFDALMNLGYLSNTVENLESGMTLLRTAQRLYREKLSQARDVDDTQLARALRRLHGFLAIAEFDAWRFGTAAQRLESCVREMRALVMTDDLARTLAVLGQLHTATGSFERARDVLSEGIAAFSHRRDNVALRAYNRSLLGKLYLEWGRLRAAHAALTDGFREVEGTRREEYWIDIRLYLSELLIHDGHYDEASAHLHAIYEAAASNGFPNLLIVARSLGAEIELARGDYEAALRASGPAVGALDVRRPLVLVRSEEVFPRHARI